MTDSDDTTPAADPFARMRALRTPFASDVPVDADEPGDPIGFWEDIIDDPSWLEDDSETDHADVTDATPIPCPDIAGDLTRSISELFGRPGVDFARRYVHAYSFFETADRRMLDAIADAEAAGIDPDDPRAAGVMAQARRVEALRAEHMRRHQELLRQLDPATGAVGRRMLDDNRRATADRLELTRAVDARLIDDAARRGEQERRSADQRHARWLSAFTR